MKKHLFVEDDILARESIKEEQMKEKHYKLIWVCDKCNYVVISDTREHHKMDFCECKQSAVDLESYMCRMMGKPRTIARLEEGKKWKTMKKY